MLEAFDTILKIILAILALFGGKELIGKLIVRLNKKEKNSYVSSLLGETIGRDKFEYNYYISPGVGSEDDALNSAVFSDNARREKVINFYDLGIKKIDITSEDIIKISNLISKLSIIKLENLRPNKFPEKGVTNDHHRHLQGAVFAFGAEDYNEEWREQTSSSLREMITLFSNSENDFINTLEYLVREKKITEDELEKIKTICVKVKKYYQFFTGVTHHNKSAIINGYRQLVDYTCEGDKCLSADSFKRVIIDFFVDMKKIIEKFPNL